MEAAFISASTSITSRRCGRRAAHAYPDPVTAALIAEQAGADSITVHLREDRRHIQARDVEVLLRTLQTRLNLEMAVTDEMVDFAVQASPRRLLLGAGAPRGAHDRRRARRRRANATRSSGVPRARRARHSRVVVHRSRPRADRSERRSGCAGRRAAHGRVRGGRRSGGCEGARAHRVRRRAGALARPRGARRARPQLSQRHAGCGDRRRSSSSTSGTRSSRRRCSTASRAPSPK